MPCTRHTHDTDLISYVFVLVHSMAAAEVLGAADIPSCARCTFYAVYLLHYLWWPASVSRSAAAELALTNRSQRSRKVPSQ